MIHSTVGLYFVIVTSLFFPAAMVALGTIVHLRVTQKNGIDPSMATPRKKYYSLPSWKWYEKQE